MTSQRADKAGATDFWHYAVGSEKRGPVPRATLSKLLASGEVSAETYVWQPGMDNWVHLGDAPPLRELVAALGGDSVEDFVEEDTAFTPADQVKAAHHALDDDDDLSQDTIVESVEVARAAAVVPLAKQAPSAVPLSKPASAVAPAPKPVVPAAEDPVFSAPSEATVSISTAAIFGDDADDDIFSSASAEAAPGVHGRRQSSVLFTLDDLGGEQGGGRTGDEQFVTDSSGLIDIKAIANSERKVAQDDPFSAPPQNLIIPPRTGVAPLAIPIIERRRGIGPWILGAAAVLVIGGVALVFLLKGDSTAKSDVAAQVSPTKVDKPDGNTGSAQVAAAEPKNEEKTPEAAKADVVEAKADVVEAKADVEVAKAEPAKPEEIGGGAEVKVADASKVEKPKTEKVEKPKTEKVEKPKTEKVEEKPVEKPKPEVKIEVATPASGNNSEKVNDLLNKLNSKDKTGGGTSADAGGDTLPDKLSAAAVRNAIKGRFASCGAMVTNASGPVTVQTQFVISSSGVVQSARVTDGGGTSADVHRCVVGVIKATTFGKFKDPTMQVNLPVKLL